MFNRLLLCGVVSAMALGAAGFSGLRQAPRTQPAALLHDTPHVLNYPNVGTNWPNWIDPAFGVSTQDYQVQDMLYSNMVKLNIQNHIVPELASSWSISDGGKVYTFHLRTDSKFSDGNPITADDVIYSLDRALNPKVYHGAPSPNALNYLNHIVGAASYKGRGDVAGLKRIDAHTVQITLDSPIAFFLQTLAYPTGYILEKGKTPIGGLTTKNPMQNQISSGPWMIASYRYQSSMTFVPNPGYYNYHKMKLKEIDMPFINDYGTEYQGYESGQYAMGDVPSIRLAAARAQPDFHSTPILTIDYIVYNVAKPPFNNKNLRLAASYAINRDLINQKVLHGLQTTIYSIVPKGVPGYDANGAGHVPGYDLAKAKRYLALAKQQMGAAFPRSVTIYYQNVTLDFNHEYVELQSEWKQIGLNVKIQGISFNAWINHVIKPTASVTYQGGDPWVEYLWIDDYPDAYDFTNVLLSPASTINVGNYSNPQFVRLIDQAATTRGAARAPLYVQASRLALNDVAWSMIGQQTANWRWRQNITGLTLWSGELYPMPAGHDWTNVDVR